MYYRRLYLFITLISLVLSGLQASLLGHTPVVYMIGDSTMAQKRNPERNPMYGWGQVLHEYLECGVEIQNRALDGRSTRSFVAEGQWDRVLETLGAGDWVIIQFGHNDQKSDKPKLYTDPSADYREFLEKFIQESRARGARPILATSIYRRYFKQGTAVNSLGSYPDATREVAEAWDVPLIDLNQLTGELLDRYGESGSRDLFVHFEPGENDYFPDGIRDNSHLSRLGAREVAALFTAEIQSLDIGFPVKAVCAQCGQ